MLRRSRRHRSIALEAMRATCSPTSGPRPASSSASCWSTLTGWLWLDPAVAIGVALNILREGARAVWRLGRRPDGQGARARGAGARSTARWRGFAHQHDPLRPHRRRAAPAARRFVDLHMHMPASWTLGRAAALRGDGRAGADERGAGPARVDPAAADRRRGALQRRERTRRDRARAARRASARVASPARVVGAIGAGLLVFVCAEPATARRSPTSCVAKLLKLRIFADDAGKMNRSVADVGGGLLVVSQFTLAADTSRRQPARASPARAGPSAAARSTRRRRDGARARHAGGRSRRVRRRHAGAPRQRRAGDDPAHACVSQPAARAGRRCSASTRATCSASRPAPSAIWWRQLVPSATTIASGCRAHRRQQAQLRPSASRRRSGSAS